VTMPHSAPKFSLFTMFQLRVLQCDAGHRGCGSFDVDPGTILLQFTRTFP